MLEEIITDYIDEHVIITRNLLTEATVQRLVLIAQTITTALENGGKVVLFGNGGSAADAQHIAAELVGRFQCDRVVLPALALTTNTSIITAIANDYSFDQVFARQVEAMVTEKDVVIGISTSGNSLDVINGIQTGKQKGAITISFTGKRSSPLCDISDICLKVPSTKTNHIQESHIMLGHIVCLLTESGIDGELVSVMEDEDVLIKVVALDIDGVLTDGTITIDGNGRESKSLSFLDIDAVFRGRREGLQFALITGEDDILVDHISKRLGVDLFLKGAKDKAKAIKEVSQQLKVSLKEICYIGDSERDAPALEMVGLGIAPSNASDEAKKAAHYVCRNAGGNGAGAEGIEKCLKARRR